jgi:hypothetical protein
MVGSVYSLDSSEIKVILATDCGSTTSKARLFKKIGESYRFITTGEAPTTTGEAPTTVETPFEDVTLGVRNAVREIEELLGHKLLDDRGIITPSKGENEGVDLYVTTSSAGGGLRNGRHSEPARSSWTSWLLTMEDGFTKRLSACVTSDPI